MINSLKTFTDEYAFEEKLTNAEIKNLISKSNALKRAATEKQNFLDSLSRKDVCYSWVEINTRYCSQECCSTCFKLQCCKHQNQICSFYKTSYNRDNFIISTSI